ncbi:MAG: sigma-70 family RNA polymerase sigma factor, partial [Pseudomonadota bacterium]
EVAQETWLAVIANSENFNYSAKFSTWLFTIARRKMIDQWRRHQTARKTMGSPVQDRLQEIEDRGGLSGSGQLELKQLLEIIENLNPQQMEAVLLKIEGFSNKEIADITEAKPETVKSRLRYATKSLRTLLQV